MDKRVKVIILASRENIDSIQSIVDEMVMGRTLEHGNKPKDKIQSVEFKCKRKQTKQIIQTIRNHHSSNMLQIDIYPIISESDL